MSGVFGVVLFLENPSLWGPDEKELDSSVSEPFKLGDRIELAPFSWLMLIEHLLGTEPPPA